MLRKSCPLCDRKVALTARGCRDCGVWFKLGFHRDAVNRVIGAVAFGLAGWLIATGWGLLAGGANPAPGADASLPLAAYAGGVLGALLGRPYRGVK